MRVLLLSVIATTLTLAACGETEEAEVPAGATEFTLTPAGGTFSGTGALAGVVLTVPAGAVDADLALWMAPPSEDRPLPETGRFVGPEFEFGPLEVALETSAELTVPFDPAEVSATGLDLIAVKVWRVGPEGWTIDDPAAAAMDGQVTVQIDTLSRFGAGVELE